MHIFSYDRTEFGKRLRIKLPQQELAKNSLKDSNDYVVIAFGGLVQISLGRGARQKCIEVVCANLSNADYKYGLKKAQRTHSVFTEKLLIPFSYVRMMPIGSIFEVQFDAEGKAWLNFTKLFDYPSFNFAISDNTKNVEFVSFKQSDDAFNNYTSLMNNSLLYELLDKKKKYLRFYHYDETTWIVTNYEGVRYFMHPAMFLSAHYGASSEITRVLLNYSIWDDLCNAYHADYISQVAPDGICPNHVVMIGNKQAIDDCVFLYHFKINKETREIVRNLHNKIAIHLLNSENLKRFYLPEVRPYHKDAVSLSVRGVPLGDNEVLVTQIEQISEPEGPPIFYDIRVSNNKNQTNGEVVRFKRGKTVARNIRRGEVLVVSDQVNNLDVAISRSGITVVDDNLRRKIRNQEITRDEDMQPAKAKYVVPRKAAEAFASGDRLGDGGIVGFLRIMHGELMFDDYAGDINPQFRQLVDSALNNANRVQSFTFKEGLHEHGKIVPMCFKSRYSFPRSVLVLVLEIDGGKYVFVDCERDELHKCAGVAIAWDNSWSDEGFKAVLRRVLGEMSDNSGSLSQEFREEVAAAGVALVTYRHTGVGDWVKTAVGKFES